MDDEPEAKCTTDGLAPMEVTPSVRFSLVLLRGYLMVMAAMLVYHVLHVTGVFGK